MNDRLRRVGVIALVAVFTLYAFAPLLRAGFVGTDLGVVAELGERVRAGTWPGSARDLYTLEGAEGRPGAALSLLISSSFAAPDGVFDLGSARWLRVENFLLLLLAAMGLRGALRRALRPWLGMDQARAAGVAAAVLLLVHPLCISSVARVASRGDLLALALGAWTLQLFLRGRQREELVFVGAACILAILSGACSKLAVFLPPLCSGMEYVSARRHRRRPIRVRTGATTFVVFSACVGLEWAGRVLFAPPGVSDVLPGHYGPGAAILGIEKLGVLVLPVNTFGVGAIGYAFAGIAVMLALHPGFVAARAAPRLWGRILLACIVSIVATEALEPVARVWPESLAGAHLLLASTLVMAVAFGISSTAISGARRSAMPAAIIFLYALLAHGNAVPIEEAAGALDAFRLSVHEEARKRDWKRDFLVIDPRSEVAGVDTVEPALAHLFDLSLLPAGAPPEAVARVVRATDIEAFRAFLREPEFTAWRERGAVLLLPSELVPGATAETTGGNLPVAVDLPSPEPSTGRLLWRETGRSPSGNVLEALRARSIKVLGLPSARTQDAPVVRWSASSGVANIDEVVGVWISSPDGPVAMFDLESSLDWILGDRVRSVWFTGPLNQISSAQVHEGPPPIAGDPVPRPVGEDWLFDIGTEPPPVSIGGEANWVLGLLDLGALAYEEFALRLESAGRLRAAGMVSRVESMQFTGPGPFVWYLDYRVEGMTIARASGRRPTR